ncbi:MAG: DUF1566 domain-containing protein [Deltaproteobacteria bacterium]|nr:DUF1566 domain-containing protein [Deltaproteobacteria bacterium]
MDMLTGCQWTRNASPAGFPLSWAEAHAFIEDMNAHHSFGYHDWRLPERNELFSLVSHQQINPSLPAGHPFENVFTGYYWTAAPCARFTSQAWYVHLGGARVFKGMKHGSYMVWPVRGGSLAPCDASCRQATDHGLGLRFSRGDQTVVDRFTGLEWTKRASGLPGPVNWKSALKAVEQMNAECAHGSSDWRLPNIRELESLVDLIFHSPALPQDHPFDHVQAYYWSSTTSAYDPSYAWVLYLVDGAVGVGYKQNQDFFAWAVRRADSPGTNHEP